MFRSKPTRVFLTEDDLCYHIDSIFSRNDQLTKWHRRHTGSGSSYDGDDDEDGLFLESDTLSQSETLFESECDETQQQMTAEGSGRETLGRRYTRASVSSLRFRQVSVRFASPGSSLSSPGADSDPQLSQVIVRNQRPLDDPQLDSIQSVTDTHLLPLPLQLALLSSTDWNRVRGGFTSQNNNRDPHSLAVPSPSLSRPVEIVLDTNLAKLLSSVTALPVGISGRESAVGLFESPRKNHLSLNRLVHGACVSLDAKPSPTIKPHDPPSSHLPQIQHIPSPPLEMKRTRHTDSAFTDRGVDEQESSGVLAHGANTQNCLAETAPNSGNAILQLSSPEDAGYRSIKERSSSPTEVIGDILETYHTADLVDRKVTRSRPSRETKEIPDLASHETVSRATQTDLDPEWSNERYGDEGLLNSLERQENLDPGQPVGRRWQDPFITTMFAEPNVPVYDPSNQLRRGMQGRVSQPVGRGRVARNQRGVLGQLPHPTLVDAATFQEYVLQLIAELEHAP